MHTVLAKLMLLYSVWVTSLTGPRVEQEMYFRHLYATVQPTLEQRCDSWDNYCALFNVILSSNINMQVCFVLQQLLMQATFILLCI